MTYAIKKIFGEPIIVAAIHEDYVPRRDIAQSDAEAITLLDTCTAPVFLIIDVRSFKQITMDDIFLAVKHSSYGDDSLYRHPMLREVIFISTNPAVKTATEGLSHAAFGEIKARTVDTLEAALAYARQQSHT